MKREGLSPTRKQVKPRTLKDGSQVVTIGAEIYLDTWQKLNERNTKISAFVRETLRKAI
jgi:hypothetical protein